MLSEYWPSNQFHLRDVDQHKEVPKIVFFSFFALASEPAYPFYRVRSMSNLLAELEWKNIRRGVASLSRAFDERLQDSVLKGLVPT